MWKLGWEISFNKHVFKNIYLKLPRNCCFKIINTYYIYNWDDEGTYIDVVTYVDEEDETAAYRQAYKNIKETNYILSYLYSIDFQVNSHEFFRYKFEKVDAIDNVITEKSNFNITRIENINTKIQSFNEKTYKYFIKCVEFFSKGLDYHYNLYLNEEALLSLFKSIELISLSYSKNNIESTFEKNIINHFNQILKETFNEDYNKEVHSAARKSIKNTLFSLLSLKRKIKFTIKGMEMDTFMPSDDIDNLINFRNSILAHGNIKEVNEDYIFEYFVKTLNLSKEVLSKFFFDSTYKDINLNLDCELW